MASLFSLAPSFGAEAARRSLPRTASRQGTAFSPTVRRPCRLSAIKEAETSLHSPSCKGEPRFFGCVRRVGGAAASGQAEQGSRRGVRQSLQGFTDCSSSSTPGGHKRALAVAPLQCTRHRRSCAFAHLDTSASPASLAPPSLASGQPQGAGADVAPAFAASPVFTPAFRWPSAQLPSRLAGRRAAVCVSRARLAGRTRPAASNGQLATAAPPGADEEEGVVSLSEPLPLTPSFVPSVAFAAHKPVPLDSPLSPSLHATPQVRRPGSVVRMNEVIRHWWSVPAVGFNSVLEVPIYRFELFQRRNEEAEDSYEEAREELVEHPDEEGCVVLPNDIFGLPIRPDILYRCYWFYRRAIAGWTERMQLFKREWPGSKRKLRPQQRSGRARIGWRKAPGKYVGVKAHPLRPHDQRIKIPKRLLWQGLKIMLSAKFAQGQIKVVDHFNLQSHKTKHCVRHLRRILGRKCPSALLVHEGTTDVNDNFRYATAHILAVRRENVEGVNVYNLLKYRQLVITEKALLKLIYNIQTYPEKRGWLPKYATPDGRPAPVPEKVEGWDREWNEMKERERNAKFSKALLRERILKWKWSDETKGAIKISRVDPFKGFRLARFSLHQPTMPWEKVEESYVDTDPLEEDEEGDVFDEAQAEETQRLERLDDEELPSAEAFDETDLNDVPLAERVTRSKRLENFKMEHSVSRNSRSAEDLAVNDESNSADDCKDEESGFLPPVDKYVTRKNGK
ncbi:putative 50S ribosomal protein L4 [Besnoitia besnoiti]|uniref:Large ribosomal subunit protein uL4m n=1 Tax=Besnoitia besnoiti TaxID=94643 RepID=A0A2A9MD35_BESBE|nr:putative 50S ribosomal protein L4 [Besnoitia besnoiti]PFH35905.1 putative 50S ribosomal protein L4 [Besnoitia besnoiti]